MNKLTKSHIGLGEVRNRVSPSIEEYEVLLNKLDELNLDQVIVGQLSTLEIDPRVYLDSNNNIVINLDKVKRVSITLDIDFKSIILVGGFEGREVTFELLNQASYDIQWVNLRVSGGLSPGISLNGSTTGTSNTIYEVLRLGNQYYLTNELLEV